MAWGVLHCELGNTYKTATAAELYKSWTAYAHEAGETPETKTSFGERLRTAGKGIIAKRKTKGVIYQCIRLLPVASYHETEGDRDGGEATNFPLQR